MQMKKVEEEKIKNDFDAIPFLIYSQNDLCPVESWECEYNCI